MSRRRTVLGPTHLCLEMLGSYYPLTQRHIPEIGILNREIN